MTTTERLAQLGIELPAVAAPVAAYVPALAEGALVYTSGQLPFMDGALPVTGAVGPGPQHVSPEQASALARQCALNALAAAAQAAGGVDRIVGVVKVVGFVSSTPDFFGQPTVINGASEVLGEIFGEAGAHARSAVGVAALPLNSPVEVELIVRVAQES